MKVSVIGGTGVIADGLVPALLKHGHEVVIAARRASEMADAWPDSVSAVDCDVTDPESLRELPACDAMLHLTGIVEEHPPDITFQRVNIDGTRNVVEAAKRLRVQRFVHISSLGADRGKSQYHESKRAAEEIVRQSSLPWTIVRPGGVYGPGDETLSTILRLVRNSPVVPVVDDGEQQFQPIWFEDLGWALAKSLEADSCHQKTFELAGSEILSVNELITRLRRLTRRAAPIVRTPSWLTKAALRIASWARCVAVRFGGHPRLSLPINDAKLTMLLEGNLVEDPAANRLVRLIGREPTPLSEGLRRLVDEAPETPPSQGVGAIRRKRFRATFEVRRAGNPAELMWHFKQHIAQIMPIDFCAEPGASDCIDHGSTFTAQLPIRGNIQIRVEECDPRSVIFVTLEGHPLAGMVQFKTAPTSEGTEFCIEIHSRAGSLIDWIAERTFAWYIQNRMWRGVLKRLSQSLQCPIGRIQFDQHRLRPDESKRVEEIADQLVHRRRRNEQLRLLRQDGESHLERAHR